MIKIKITKQLKADLEEFAKRDGVQRGIMTDTSGNQRIERVSATAAYPYLFKTENGSPFNWLRAVLDDVKNRK